MLSRGIKIFNVSQDITGPPQTTNEWMNDIAWRQELSLEHWIWMWPWVCLVYCKLGAITLWIVYGMAQLFMWRVELWSWNMYLDPGLYQFGTTKVGNFEFVPYQRYTGSTIGKIILPVRPPKNPVCQNKAEIWPGPARYAEDLSLNYEIIILKWCVPYKSWLEM